MRHEPDHVILHIGTNDLNSKLSSEYIAESMVNLAMSLKIELNNVFLLLYSEWTTKGM